MIPPWIKNSPVLPWIFLFFSLSLSVTQYGGMNAKSRIATMRAITEQGTFSIDRYKEWTVDWSLSPNGHYYSNKAPGGALLGFPVFALIDLPIQWFSKKPRDGLGRLPEPGHFQLTFLVFFTQLLPFALLVLFLSKNLLERGIPTAGVHFFALAALFGNTAALYMNSYFGHGFAAWLFLGATYFWLERRYLAASALLAFCMLTDYGGAVAIPFFALATLLRERSLKPALPALAGAIPAGILWIWYHWSAFGSPFALASQFINPEQVHALPGREHLSETFSALPSIEVLWQLLFGQSRGLLFTQPWMLPGLVLLIWAAFWKKTERTLAIFLLGSFLGLLWMNSGFGGWHGGWALGPRYLSLIFPAMAFASALLWGSLPKPAQGLLWASLVVALLFRLWVYPFPSLAPEVNLWVYHFHLFQEAERSTPFVRMGMGLIFTALALFWAGKRSVNARQNSA